jgi:dihydroflavonol-4-reductase
MQTAFVTGSTGLLGNNLVRLLARRGVRVRALARSREKAIRQFAGVPVEIVEGDMLDVARFAPALAGCDALFHTAAHFRDSYKGGQHWDRLHAINVEGTGRLLEAAYAAGIRRAVHTSSVAVLNGPPGQLINEAMERREADADDYYRSKILADRKVHAFLDCHPGMFIAMVLPGWMFGPGDVGPTSSGQVVMDFARRKLPGRIPGSFSVVDARDVARHQIAALERGRSGERYLAAGRHMTMDDLFPLLAKASGVAAPTRRIPLAMLRALAAGYELYAGVTGRPALVSRASVKLLAQEADRSHYDHAKSERELGCTFRPAAETLADTVAWYRANGDLPAHPVAPGRDAPRAAQALPGAVSR